MAEPFAHTLRVRYSECDAQGVLFNANYLEYVDHTITEMWRAAYGGYTVMLGRGIYVVVAEAGVRFRAPARFDEEVMIEAAVTRIGTTSVSTDYTFTRGGEVLAEAQMRHVFIDRATGLKTPRPDWARDGLAGWLVDAAEIAGS